MAIKSTTRLGDLLQKKGLLTSEQLRIAISTQTKRRQQLDPLDTESFIATSLGEILIELGFIDRLQLNSGLNWQNIARKMALVMSLCAPLVSLSYQAKAAGSALPIVIQAENYSEMKNINTEATTDVGGGLNVGWIDANDWLTYTTTPVEIPFTGSYKMTYRVASLNGGGMFALREAGSNFTHDTISVPKTAGWQKWIDVQRTITLTSGTHLFGLKALAGGFNINWFKVEHVSLASSSSSSVKSTSSVAVSSRLASSMMSSAKPASSIAASSNPPGSASFSSKPASSSSVGNVLPITIQAENYFTMSGVYNEPTTDTGGGQDTGNINTDDWMDYANTPVNIPVSGSYKITYRLASLAGGGSLSLFGVSNNAVYDTFSVPNTGGWQNWIDVQRTVTLGAGIYTFGIRAAVGGFNVNWFKIDYASDLSSSSSSVQAVSSVAASSKPTSAVSSTSRNSVPASSLPASSSGSSVSSVVSTQVAGPVAMSWKAPNLRENGSYLDITEVGGYDIRYKTLAAVEFTHIFINDAWINYYNFDWLEGNYIFQIAAFDKTGVYSNFVNVTSH